MSSLLTALKNKKILVSDGAWGTFLHQRGLQPGECPELWNCNHRDDVFAIAKSYIDAGADIILTNSFGGSLIIIGSVSNIIVVQQARALGIKISFWDFARLGIPVTLAALAGLLAWIALVT